MGVHFGLQASSGVHDTSQVLETTNQFYLAPANGDNGQVEVGKKKTPRDQNHLKWTKDQINIIVHNIIELYNWTKIVQPIT
jgi:hypothetical protein